VMLPASAHSLKVNIVVPPLVIPPFALCPQAHQIRRRLWRED
jgi:hypothetical protein